MTHFKKTYLDVIDSSGNPTGIVKSYDDIHRDGDWHRGVHVWGINKKGQLLLQKRSLHVHTYPGFWYCTASGHIDAGEDSLSSAQKEVHEEIGIYMEKEKFEYIGTITDQFVINTQNGKCVNRELDDIYLVSINNESEIKANTLEVAEVVWMDYATLEKEISKGNSHYVPHQTVYDLLFPLLHKRFDNLN